MTNLQTVIKNEAWRKFFPVETLQKAFQSEKPALLFLDSHDSDFESYLIEVLRTEQDFLSYYADYVHHKKSQITFAQTLLSLLFLDSTNVQTSSTFAHDAFDITKGAFFSMDYTSVRQWMNVRVSALFKVFRAFLFGNTEERSASIAFLKCMKCPYGHLESFGFPNDLSDQENTARFFSNIINCFYLGGDHRKIVICIGNIPIHEMMAFSIANSGLQEVFEKIPGGPAEYRFKLCLVSKGHVLGNDLDEHTLDHEYNIDNLSLFFEPVYIPKISDSATIKRLVSSIVSNIDAPGIHTNSGKRMVISDLISEDIVEQFSKTLTSEDNRKARIIDIANGLSALVGIAVQKYPTRLVSDDVQILLDESDSAYTWKRRSEIG